MSDVQSGELTAEKLRSAFIDSMVDGTHSTLEGSKFHLSFVGDTFYASLIEDAHMDPVYEREIAEAVERAIGLKLVAFDAGNRDYSKFVPGPYQDEEWTQIRDQYRDRLTKEYQAREREMQRKAKTNPTNQTKQRRSRRR